ncbi:hypothetical protein J3B02_005376 [Coemansia erecta]|uniref:Uncharacterized protein n=1 Tax=Coemansia asiatica TaxID=1052880 RepID=A0A9W8CJP6_9FUNG|nr:hypothetical protein LPJ64_001749 [Coemansia asiatica]KAJ2843097.1 hypothetical protein J3B02_005376 [Coemansia erecta]
MDALEKPADIIADGRSYNQVYRTSISGLDNIVIPHPPQSYQQANHERNDKEKTREGDQQQLKEDQVVVSRRSLWMRIIVDAMFVPFIQGFMLNIGTHWVRNWRKSGGLIGLFKRSSKPTQQR